TSATGFSCSIAGASSAPEPRSRFRATSASSRLTSVMAEPAILKVEAASGGYGDNTVLHGVDLQALKGSWTTIIGANGAGKSTLLKLVAGVVACRSGRVLFDGADITRLSAIERLRAGIGLVPQGRCNFPLLSVAENLMLGGYSRRLQRAELARETDAMAARFPRLRDRWHVDPGNLSGDEQQL